MCTRRNTPCSRDHLPRVRKDGLSEEVLPYIIIGAYVDVVYRITLVYLSSHSRHLQIEESHKQSNELVAQFLQQTEELNKDKMRLSKTVREGREERENLLNIIENLANRVVL